MQIRGSDFRLPVKEYYMSRAKRELEEHVWYFIRTVLNDREPMFWSKHLIWLFRRVLSELLGFFAVEIRGLRFDGATVSFYIRPDKGLELPKIIKWVKQTFAVRYNLLDARTGHIWGDRYFSEIVAGEPPVWAEAHVFMEIARPVRRGDWRREAERTGFEPRCGKVRCCRTCRGRAGQTPVTDGGGKPPVPAGVSGLSAPPPV
jgi:REP element-mobilizing transposase RayT